MDGTFQKMMVILLLRFTCVYVVCPLNDEEKTHHYLLLNKQGHTANAYTENNRALLEALLVYFNFYSNSKRQKIEAIKKLATATIIKRWFSKTTIIWFTVFSVCARLKTHIPPSP